MTPKSKEELAEEYTNTDYFRLEYSTFGTTAKECQKAFLAGYKACEERDRDLKDDIIHVLSLASMDNFSRRELAFEAKVLLQEIRMRDEANRTNN